MTMGGEGVARQLVGLAFGSLVASQNAHYPLACPRRHGAVTGQSPG
jgi:hypothetical protein